MNKSNLATAEAYYSAMRSGDYEKMGSYLHKDVKYSDPRWPLTGKDQVWPIAKSFSDAVNQLKTVGKFSTDDQVMLVQDVIFHGSEKPLRTAVLMTFDEELIKEIGLTADISQHMDVCTEIFSYGNKSNLATAEAYYSAMRSGDYEKMGSYLHKDVKYSDPRWPLTGKDQVWPIAKSFSDAVNQLKTVGKFSTDDQVMLVQDVIFDRSEKPLRTAVLMTFDEGLIKEIGLIADISQHMDVCTEIFSYGNKSNLATAEAYYSAIQHCDYEKMGSYLHKDVKYSDPRWPLTGKDRVWPIAKSFSDAVKHLRTVGKFSTNDQVMLVQDVIFHGSEKPLRTAVLMTFDEELIKEIGLTADISQHMDVCTEIFSYQP